MSFKRPLVTLKKAGISLIDCDHKTPKAQEHGRPYIGIPQLKDGRITQDGARLISEEDFHHWRRKANPMPDDVILSRRCNPGESAYVSGDFDFALGQNLVLLRSDGTKVYPPFLRWLTRDRHWWSQVNKYINVGAVFDSLKCAEIPRFEIYLPPLGEQKLIADFLGAIDKKIQLNQQVNQTLEQMAQAIFKSWFVDFEPVKAKIAALEAGGSEDDALLAAMQAIAGSALFATDAADADAQTQLARLQTEQPEQYTTLRSTAELFPSAMQESELGEIPMGWEAGSIGDIATVRGGYAFKGSQFEEHGNPVVKIKNIVGDGTVKLTGTQCVDDAVAETAYRFQLNDGDLVMAMTGATVGKTGLVLTLGEKVFLNQRVAVFQSKYFGSKISWFLFCLFARKDIFDVVVGTAQGSAQPNISSSGIEAVPIVVPAHEVLEKYLSITDGLFKSWLENNRQSENLSSLRDTLLPKLLSGELSLAVAEEQLADTVEPAHV